MQAQRQQRTALCTGLMLGAGILYSLLPGGRPHGGEDFDRKETDFADVMGDVERVEAEAPRVARLGGARENRRRFNVSVPRARVPEKASTRRDRSER